MDSFDFGGEDFDFNDLDLDLTTTDLGGLDDFALPKVTHCAFCIHRYKLKFVQLVYVNFKDDIDLEKSLEQNFLGNVKPQNKNRVI